MSTPENAVARSGSLPRDDSVQNHVSLPTFVATRGSFDRRQSQAESSNSGSRRSALDFQKRSRSTLRESLSVRASDESDSHDVSPAQIQRRRNRTSGGFLLESVTRPTRLSRSLLHRSQHDKKGKRKSDNSELSVTKRRTRVSVAEQGSSIGGSPLSSETRGGNDGLGISDADGMTDVDKAVESQQDGTVVDSNTQRTDSPAIGFDSDSTQIVDMAMRLSEARQRRISDQRYASSGAGGQRIVSATSPKQTRTRAISKSFGPHIAPPRTPITPTKGFAPEEVREVTNIETTPDQQHNDILQPDDAFEVSRATIARAEKARNYLELAYEHRRLLSHLPPIRSPDRVPNPASPGIDSRCYNPLQYARNRKLRLREKSTINGGLEGWHNAEKVRAWVDTVIGSHSETRHDPIECVRLPPLSLEEAQVSTNSDEQSHTSPRFQNDQKNRLRRPKSDWVTHPGDIIADIHWLEQGLNKTKIQDRDNNPIYPPNTQFKFSGWRNRTPMKVPETLQEPTPPPDEIERFPSVEIETPPLESAPVLPTFKSAHKTEKAEARRHGSRKFKDTPDEDTRSSKRLAIFNSSDSDMELDSSNHDEDGSRRRGRRRLSKRDELILSNGNPFGRPTDGMRNHEDAHRDLNLDESNLSGRNSTRASLDRNRLIKHLRHNSSFLSSRRGSDTPSKQQLSKWDGFDNEREQKPSTAGDGDTTASTSPVSENIPSIAINLSPPPSRSSSPVKKPKNSLLHAILEKHHSQGDHIDRSDFALHRSKSHSRQASMDVDNQHDSSEHHSRGTSPLTRGTSPLDKLRRHATPRLENLPAPPEHRDSTISRNSVRFGAASSEHPSRIRGMFKGGRIAEIVGHEVHRVGDFIWKRDPPVSGSSLRSYHTSDTDEETLINDTTPNVPPSNKRISTSTRSSYKADTRSPVGDVSEESTPQYHNPNLPSFTEPFQKDREKQDKQRDQLSPTSAMSPAQDHISQQAAQHRAGSKSPRLDRLAPPRLETNENQFARDFTHRGSYGFGAALDFSNSQLASKNYNDAINSRSRANLSGRSSATAFAQHMRQSIENIAPPDSSYQITKQDVSKIEALFLMSAVKAKALVAVQDQIPPRPSQFLIDTIIPARRESFQSTPPRIRRRDEHVRAARNLISTLRTQSDEFKDKLAVFGETTMAGLHADLQRLEDTMENELTPRVRISADNAGELSMKLTTTSTLAVKEINDRISEGFTLRRRGPFRYLRLLGYGIIEWVVVGLLWVIWAVVMCIQFVLGICRNCTRVGRWLFWLD